MLRTSLRMSLRMQEMAFPGFKFQKKIWGVCPHTRGLRPLVPSYNFRVKLDAQNICRKWYFWASNLKDFPPDPLFMRGMSATRGLQPLLSPSDILSPLSSLLKKCPPLSPGKSLKKALAYRKNHDNRRLHHVAD
jgi:hypothetical protein